VKSGLIHTLSGFDAERSNVLSANSLNDIFHSLLHPRDLGSWKEDTDRLGTYSCLSDPKEFKKKIHGVLINIGLSAGEYLLCLL